MRTPLMRIPFLRLRRPLMSLLFASEAVTG